MQPIRLCPTLQSTLRNPIEHSGEGATLRSVLEPVCDSELFALHSISPLEPDMGGGATFRGALVDSTRACILGLD